MKAAFSRVFTLEVDGRPILAFEASGTKEARQICKESWLLNDLSLFTSGGNRLRIAKSTLTVRLASADDVDSLARLGTIPTLGLLESVKGRMGIALGGTKNVIRKSDRDRLGSAFFRAYGVG